MSIWRPDFDDLVSVDRAKKPHPDDTAGLLLIIIFAVASVLLGLFGLHGMGVI
jgi:hypothetical protein